MRFFHLSLFQVCCFNFNGETKRIANFCMNLLYTVYYNNFILCKVVQIRPGLIFFCNHNCSSLQQLPDRSEQVLTRAGGRVEVVASFSQGRTAAAQSGLFTHKLVPVIIGPPCTLIEQLPGYRPATSWVHYTTSCNTQSSAPEDGRDHRPKHAELIGIINKLLLLHPFGVYIIYT